MMTPDELIENFELLDDWEDRYRYVIDLGKKLPEFPETRRDDDHKVPGCMSQVWMTSEARTEGDDTVLEIRGDSDAHIVRGLIGILLEVYSGRPAREILALDIGGLFEQLGLDTHLTANRRNGFTSMVQRIRNDAVRALQNETPGSAATH